jgi:hypothetical protein
MRPGQLVAYWTWVEEQLIDLSVAFSPVSIKS